MGYVSYRLGLRMLGLQFDQPLSFLSARQFSPCSAFLLPPCFLPRTPATSQPHSCLTKTAHHPERRKRLTWTPPLPFPAVPCLAIASRIQAATFIWINSPFSFLHLCRCPHRCDLVCHLSGPELTAPDGCPPGARG